MPPSSTRPPSGASLAAATYVFGVVMVGTTLPTPLYPGYEARFGFGGTMTTVLFAVYAVGVVVALVLAGRLSESVGRRPMLLAGIVLSLASAVVFAVGTDLPLLFTGRVLSGFSAGVFTATGTVSVLENAPEDRRSLAGALATAANIGGLGLGMLLAGVVASVFPAPLHTPYLVHAGLLVVAGVALLAVREGVTDRARPRVQLPGVPAEARPVFRAASVGAVAGFAVCGLFSSVAPNFMASVIGVREPAAVGAVVAALFVASAVAQILLRGLADRRLVVVGTVLLAAGMAVLVLALTASSLPVLLAASALAGAGQGLLFTTGLRAITAVTAPEHRTGATTSYFVVAYVAIAVPAIAAGLLAAAVGLVLAGVLFAAAVVVLVLLGLTGIRRFRA